MIHDYFADLAVLAAGAADSIGEETVAASLMVAEAVLSGRTLYTFGNGGSATQAQHFSAELVVRYKDDRPALPAVALTADIAILTACANDFDYSEIFARQIEALGRPGDVAFGLSTSGKSPNVLKALRIARLKGLSTILLTGEKGRAEAANWVSNSKSARMICISKLSPPSLRRLTLQSVSRSNFLRALFIQTS